MTSRRSTPGGLCYWETKSEEPLELAETTTQYELDTNALPMELTPPTSPSVSHKLPKLLNECDYSADVPSDLQGLALFLRLILDDWNIN
jgi:hypothetical protein